MTHFEPNSDYPANSQKNYTYRRCYFAKVSICVDSQLASGLRPANLDVFDWQFYFQVKFYPPEPTMLHDEVTRYHLALQVRQDIFTGKLPCSWVTQALLGSFQVQSELGDYDPTVHVGTDYLRQFEFVRNHTDHLLQKISELHATHKWACFYDVYVVEAGMPSNSKFKMGASNRIKPMDYFEMCISNVAYTLHEVQMFIYIPAPRSLAPVRLVEQQLTQ